MARLGEVPFRRYYGSVDATPLFVMLAGHYLSARATSRRSGRSGPTSRRRSGLDRRAGDPDGDGFVEYQRMTERGLANQGWKDSFDSIFHADGSAAEGPIALCEVQAYVFAAKQRRGRTWRGRSATAAGRRAGARGRDAAPALRGQVLARRAAAATRSRSTGAKQPCRVLSSNAGHALFAGIASPERAARLARLLTGRRFFSGWGVRTIAAGEARYNPMSYHNGSVWPHDNALIALGLARYGHKAEALKIFEGLIEAAIYDEFRRLPELFCGFSRRAQARADLLSGRLLAPGLGGGGAVRSGRGGDRARPRP